MPAARNFWGRSMMRQVCVFCGSNKGSDPTYETAAQELGDALADRGIGLVYGGGKIGLMGVIADALLRRDGHVIGVIPESLRALELAHEGVADLRVVNSMHARKALMADLADGFIALPGGLGTLEELFEMATWSQLGLHHKPIGVLNIAGYFDALLEWLDHAVSERFLTPEHRRLLMVGEEPAALVEWMIRFCASGMPSTVGVKWIDREQR